LNNLFSLNLIHIAVITDEHASTSLQSLAVEVVGRMIVQPMHRLFAMACAMRHLSAAKQNVQIRRVL